MSLNVGAGCVFGVAVLTVIANSVVDNNAGHLGRDRLMPEYADTVGEGLPGLGLRGNCVDKAKQADPQSVAYILLSFKGVSS